MGKSKLYDEILRLTERECGLTEVEIVESRTEVCSDARYILVAVASRYYTDTELSVYLRRTRQGINSIRGNTAKSRKRIVMEIISSIEQDISK